MRANLFKKTKYATAGVMKQTVINDYSEDENKPNVPEGLLVKCSGCGKNIYTKDLIKKYKICDECGTHFKVGAYERIRMTIDEGSFDEYDKPIATTDPLQFPQYNNKIMKLQSTTGLIDGVVTGKGNVNGNSTMIAVMDSSFLMGSMGVAIGEKLTRLFEKAIQEKLPVIVFTASGGARMQEGIFSLMQMAKVSAAVARHSQAGLLYVTVLTDPTTGGVTASFAMQGDIILSEPKALIGFAGPRVIEQTIGQKLPEGFQKAEFLLEHGFIDAIVSRDKLKNTLAELLKIHKSPKEGE